MSRGLKTALVLIAIALFCCCVAGLGATLLGTRIFGRAIITNPDRVQAVGDEIAEYDVPPDYAEIYVMNMLGMKLVAIGPANPTQGFMMIMLMQFPPGLDVSRNEMERQVEQALARQTGLGGAAMTSVETVETVINGEPVMLTVREGTTDRGEDMRQITGLFKGKGGPTILMISGELDAWDQETVDRFIASIRIVRE